MGRKILITGGTGYLASSLVNYCLRHDFNFSKITILDRTIKEGRINPDARLEFIESDLQDSKAPQADIYIHAANSNDYDLEIGFLDQIPDDAYLVYYSSAAVYGEPSERRSLAEDDATMPINAYGKHKLKMEEYVQGRFSNHLILRISNPYSGEPDVRGVYKIFQSKLEQGIKTLDLNADMPAQVIRDLIHIDDLCQMISSLIWSTARGVYNVSSGKGRSLEDLAHELAGDKHIEFNYKGVREGEIKYSVLRNEKSLKLINTNRLNTDKILS